MDVSRARETWKKARFAWAGSTRLVHREDFSGFIALAIGQRGIDRLRPAYQAMNEALARRVAERG